MPSERFLKLPEEKKKNIWEAAMAEFIRVPYDKVSINQIIKEAGISRGSFYTYFEDKNDLLAFLLENIRKRWIRSCLEGLREAEGDFFRMMKAIMDYGIAFCRDNNLIFLHQNLIMYHGALMTELKCQEEGNLEEFTEVLLKEMDRSRLRDCSEQSCVNLIQISMTALIMDIAQICMKPEKEEKIRKDFCITLEILKHGAYKASYNDQMED